MIGANTAIMPRVQTDWRQFSSVLYKQADKEKKKIL